MTVREAVPCLVVVAACNDPIVDADGGGSAADTTTDVDPSDAESSTTRSTSSQPDTGAPVDVGTALPPDAELCPAPDAQGVGVDTRMRIAFDSEATPELLTDDAMRLTCSGYLVPGTTMTGVGQLVYEPAETLPPQTVCQIELAADAATLDGVALAAGEWDFTTGDLAGIEFAFAPPVVLGEFSGGWSPMIDADDDDVIVVWVGDHPMIARSNDRGESFEVSTLQADHIADIPVTHLQNGVVHAVWRIIDTSAFDIYYSRSEPALGEMTEPMLIDTLALDTGAYPPTVTSDGADRVVIAWFETCGYQGPCSTEGPGVYTRTSTDGGATFEPAIRITQWRSSPSAGPLLGWVDGGVVAAWNEAPFEPIGITLADGEAGYAAFAQFDLAFGASIGHSSDDTATLFWHEGVTGGGGGGVARLARLRGRSADAIDPERTIAESILGTDFWVTMDAHDDVVVAIASEGVVFRSTTRRLVASLDGGESMLAPQALDFLLDYNTDVTPSDTFSIPIAIADDERAHIAWMRTSDVYVHEVMYAHGDRIAPCGVKP